MNARAIGGRVEQVLRDLGRDHHGGVRLFCSETGYADEPFLSNARAGEVGALASAEKFLELSVALGVSFGWLVTGEGARGTEIVWTNRRSFTPTPEPKSDVKPRSKP
jgi:hypothetical protein